MFKRVIGPDDLFKWCGGQYSQTDLKEALAVLLSPDLHRHQLLAQQWGDPYQRATWSLLSPHAQLLLDKLAEVSACQVSLLSLSLPAASVPPSAAPPHAKLRTRCTMWYLATVQLPEYSYVVNMLPFGVLV